MSDYLKRRDQLLMQDEEIAELKADKLVLMERDEKYCKTISGLQTANLELETENAELREIAQTYILMQDEEMAELKQQLAELREAVWIVGTERGIHRYYKPMDVAIDAALSLLQEKGE